MDGTSLFYFVLHICGKQISLGKGQNAQIIEKCILKRLKNIMMHIYDHLSNKTSSAPGLAALTIRKIYGGLSLSLYVRTSAPGADLSNFVFIG